MIYPNAAQSAAYGTTPTGYGYGSWTAVYNNTGAPPLQLSSDPVLTPNGNLTNGIKRFFFSVFHSDLFLLY